MVSADGTTTSVVVNILGTNDAAVLSSATVELTETDDAADISASGTLTVSDVDTAARRTLRRRRRWGPTARSRSTRRGPGATRRSTAHNEFKAGQTYSDTFAVVSADGTNTSVVVNILGTNDAAVLSSATVEPDRDRRCGRHQRAARSR